MHELEVLLSRLKMEHLSYHVESLLEQAGLAFVERSENVILLGPPGVGKTHLAIALGVKAVDAGHRVLFMPLDRLIATLMKAKQENRLERQLQ
ncbi:IS21 transposase orfB [Escherichia coli]|nr:IS21 transposase orfB [Escherichia coli]SQP70182.1 IS21 transposase orfB [Escherichia coli]SQZ58677.1 IS21 transposase orfB [Escherichia coli]SQZ90644.1 IS21 transposase orfB [Escherichia coli]